MQTIINKIETDLSIYMINGYLSCDRIAIEPCNKGSVPNSHTAGLMYVSGLGSNSQVARSTLKLMM